MKILINGLRHEYFLVKFPTSLDNHLRLCVTYDVLEAAIIQFRSNGIWTFKTRDNVLGPL